MTDEETRKVLDAHDAAVIPFPRGQFQRDANQREAALDELPVRRNVRPRACSHDYSTVDPAARVVYCRDCGTALDPIEVLDRIALNRERLVATGVRLRAEVEHLSGRVEKLKREEKNAKARLRNAYNPATREAAKVLRAAAQTLGTAQYAFLHIRWSEDEPLVRELGERRDECQRAASSLTPSRLVEAG